VLPNRDLFIFLRDVKLGRLNTHEKEDSVERDHVLGGKLLKSAIRNVIITCEKWILMAEVSNSVQ
jgi:hypothetical protein